MRTTRLSLALSAAAIALALVSLARADVYVPHPGRLGLHLGDVRIVEASAPREDRDAAIQMVHAAIASQTARIDRCVADHGGLGRAHGRVRARVRWDRTELPVRARIVESSAGPAARACLDEILPSLLLRPAPRGAITLDVTMIAGFQSGPFDRRAW